LTQPKRSVVKEARTRSTAPLRSSHQRAEPRNMLRTRRAAVWWSPGASASPTPAKTAANERMVLGLLSGRASVEPRAVAGPRPDDGDGEAAGCDAKVRVPR